MTAREVVAEAAGGVVEVVEFVENQPLRNFEAYLGLDCVLLD